MRAVINDKKTSIKWKKQYQAILGCLIVLVNVCVLCNCVFLLLVFLHTKRPVFGQYRPTLYMYSVLSYYANSKKVVDLLIAFGSAVSPTCTMHSLPLHFTSLTMRVFLPFDIVIIFSFEIAAVFSPCIPCKTTYCYFYLSCWFHIRFFSEQLFPLIRVGFAFTYCEKDLWFHIFMG